MSDQMKRHSVARKQALEALQRQLDAGGLKVRQATPAERERWGRERQEREARREEGKRR
jgi:hypothetical protein